MSSYKLHVVFPIRNRGGEITPSANISKLIGDDKIALSSHTTATGANDWAKSMLKDETKIGVAFFVSDTFYCRESLIHYAQHFCNYIINGGVSSEHFCYPIVYVNYYSEDGSLSNSHVGHILQFGKRFFSYGNGFAVNSHESGKVVLGVAIQNTNNIKTKMYLASLFLWMFRKWDILSAVNKKFPEEKVSTLKDLYEYLAKNFLTHSWGDQFNSNLGLSMFCWKLYQGKTLEDISANGPVNAACALDLDFLMNYLDDVFFPSGVRLENLNIGYVSGNFIKGFKELLEKINSKTSLKKFKPIVPNLEEFEIHP